MPGGACESDTTGDLHQQVARLGQRWLGRGRRRGNSVLHALSAPILAAVDLNLIAGITRAEVGPRSPCLRRRGRQRHSHPGATEGTPNFKINRTSLRARCAELTSADLL